MHLFLKNYKIFFIINQQYINFQSNLFLKWFLLIEIFNQMLIYYKKILIVSKKSIKNPIGIATWESFS